MQTGTAGAGLGLRRGLLAELAAAPTSCVDFLELAPENWIGVGGRAGKQLARLAERYPIRAHGLSLSLGGPDPLDTQWLRSIRQFLDQHAISDYSEHLSWCSAEGQLYDLLPLPFTEEAVRHVSARIGQAQNELQRRIAVENVSYYAPLPSTLSEADFITAVLRESGCDLLLDLNNIHVNWINHGTSSTALFDALQHSGLQSRISSYHIAGHERVHDALLIDTHGAPVVEPVWALLDTAHERIGIRPTLLERDFSLPPLAELLGEVERIRRAQVTAPSA